MSVAPRHFILSFFVISSLCSCSSQDRNRDIKKATNLVGTYATSETRKAWIQKVSETLHNGHGITSEKELDELMMLDDHGVVDQLMESDKFIDSVVEFNLFYLGFKADKLKYPDDSFLSVLQSKLSFPAAITAARELKNNGDYFKLYDLKHPFYAKPTLKTFFTSEGDAYVADHRDDAIAKIRQLTVNLKDYLDNEKDSSDDAFCGLVSELIFTFEFDRLGFDFFFVDHLRNSKDWFKGLSEYCFGRQTRNNPGQKKPNRAKEFLVHLDSLIDRIDLLPEYLPTLDYENYEIKGFSDIRVYDPKVFGENTTLDAFDGFAFWLNLQNSSTNYNRRRGAYFLKTYFCDDLTPINTEAPESHANDKHGSDPGCQSCHYKLDPIAGFFRNIGSFGSDYSDAERIFFDDGASMDRKEYIKEWQNPDNDVRPWNVGYMRSVNDESRNDYTDNKQDPQLKDLFEIIKRAPEAKKCLVRRMFEYYVGDQVTVDMGYLDHLTQVFSELSATNSSLGFRQTLAAIVMSHSFKQENPQVGVCYDFAPGQEMSDNRLPCQISHIVEKNCLSCHQGESARGGLDMSQWQVMEGGTQGFVHIVDGQQMTPSQTLHSIAERLSETNENIRMPLNQYMASDEREMLYLWALKHSEAKEK